LTVQISTSQFFHDLGPYDPALSVFIGVHPWLKFLVAASLRCGERIIISGGEKSIVL
jgi:hypothetical protein